MSCFRQPEKAEQAAAVSHWIEIVEQISRIAYLFAITLLVSRDERSFQSAWLYLAAIFLILYYGVWLRYFMGGREIALLRRSFLSVPDAAGGVPRAVLSVRGHLAA